MLRPDAWYEMNCFNALSPAQQKELVEVGVLEFGWYPQGWCETPATVAIETEDDATPGPRFYCLPCALAYMEELFNRASAEAEQRQREDDNARAPRL